jgi:SAM-dependent methyltransferase
MAPTNALQVDASNVDQLHAWDGDEGAYWAAHADYFDRSASPYHEKLMAAAAIALTDRVLDIGCGAGQTTRDAGRAATAGSALGVDLSSRMIDAARRRATAEGVTNAFFEQADAQIHPFEAGAFDVAISRSAAMFFGDQAAAFSNIARALRPHGRLVLTTWQSLADNEWVREIMGALAAGKEMPAPPPNARGPFALSDPDRIRDVLTSAGFTNVELEETRAGMWFGNDANDAYEFVLGLMSWMVRDLDDATRQQALGDLRSSLNAHNSGHGVVYGSAAWTIQATRM